MGLTEKQLLAEIDDLLRNAPARGGDYSSDEALSWQGRAAAVLNAWDSIAAAGVVSISTSSMRSGSMLRATPGYLDILAMLHQARHALRLSTGAPSSVAIEAGSTFHYFDSLRKTIEEATTDLLFVDPYMDAEFVSSYLVLVKPNVTIRLLSGKRIPSLVAAAKKYVAQYGRAVEVRSSLGLHDRYVFVDRRACYQSGASFKDGAKNAPTTLTQIVDAFDAVLTTYEAKWGAARVE